MARSVYSEITPEMEALANLCVKNGKIDPELYAKYDVKRGLRDINGNGVLTALPIFRRSAPAAWKTA